MAVIVLTQQMTQTSTSGTRRRAAGSMLSACSGEPGSRAARAISPACKILQIVGRNAASFVCMTAVACCFRMCCLPCCRQLYHAKIEELRGLEDLWQNRRPPEPLDLDALAPASPACMPSCSGASACRPLRLTDDHVVWDAQQNAAVFLAAVQLFLDKRADELGAVQVTMLLSQ
jgi:hypothetical protein